MKLENLKLPTTKQTLTLCRRRRNNKCVCRDQHSWSTCRWAVRRRGLWQVRDGRRGRMWWVAVDSYPTTTSCHYRNTLPINTSCSDCTRSCELPVFKQPFMLRLAEIFCVQNIVWLCTHLWFGIHERGWRHSRHDIVEDDLATLTSGCNMRILPIELQWRHFHSMMLKIVKERMLRWRLERKTKRRKNYLVSLFQRFIFEIPYFDRPTRTSAHNVARGGVRSNCADFIL